MAIRALRELGEAGADFIYQFERSGAIGAGQDSGEFLTAVAADDVGLAEPLAQQAGETFDDPVAYQVAVGIIDRLEVINIYQGERQRAVVTARPRYFCA